VAIRDNRIMTGIVSSGEMATETTVAIAMAEEISFSQKTMIIEFVMLAFMNIHQLRHHHQNIVDIQMTDSHTTDVSDA